MIMDFTLILNHQTTDINVNGEVLSFPSHSFIVLSNERTTTAYSEVPGYQFNYPYWLLYQVYRDLDSLLEKSLTDEEVTNIIGLQPIHSIKPSSDMFQVALSLAENRATVALLRFVYMYALYYQRWYFSALLKFCLSNDHSFFAFIESHCLNAWPVARFAKEFGMPLRKFNSIFHEKFGMTAKQWLIERRLQHALHLIESTPKRIVDIALECGFSHHAHFTDSFRKRYQCSPTEIRHDYRLPLTSHKGSYSASSHCAQHNS